MDSYCLTNMIIDDGFYSQETVTADFTHDNQDFSITFDKADLELINAWVFKNDRTVPAALSDNIIDSIREDVKKRM